MGPRIVDIFRASGRTTSLSKIRQLVAKVWTPKQNSRNMMELEIMENPWKIHERP